MDFSNIPPVGYAFLVVSIIAAVLVDLFIVKFGLEFLKPASAYVFMIGRAGKLVAFLAWILFFNSFWAPQYLGAAAQGILPMVNGIEWGLVAALAVLAFVTLPRPPRDLGVEKRSANV